MTGDIFTTCAFQQTLSCSLSSLRSCWNMSFSSGDGRFHLPIALQNHNRLYKHQHIVSTQPRLMT